MSQTTKKQVAKNVLGIELKEDDPVLDSIIRMNDTSKEQEYLREIDSLREGISWRAYAQKDPFVEFQHEAFKMFHELMIKIDETIAERSIKVTFLEELEKRPVFKPSDEIFEHKEYSALENDKPLQGSSIKEKTVKRQTKKVGRNDSCPCGSGKKYKKCCGK